MSIAHDLKRASGSVTITESGSYSATESEFSVPLGEGLSIQTGLLHEVCFTDVSPLSHDLSVLLGAVKCADRSIVRRHTLGWGRSINVVVPVYELGTWRRTEVAQALNNLLQYLTGDVWSVSFVKRKRKVACVGQLLLLSAPERMRVFVPFSHGLDSFAQSELLARIDSSVEVIPVHLRSSSQESSMRSVGRSAKNGPPVISVAARVNEPKRAELSFRTRPFLYDSLAAYAAVLSGGGDVLIPENGQGSLGGSLVRLGAEAPLRSCYPGFTSRLSAFFRHLTGQEVNFRHPALFRTKGQVLKELMKHRPQSSVWLKAHPSCSYDARHAHRGGERVHCGVCGNCLLRRMSLHAAGISDCTPYKVNNLAAASIEEARVDGDEEPVLRSYHDIARNAVRSMQRLADQIGPDGRYRVAAEVENLVPLLALSRTEVQEALNCMLQQHSREWMEFLECCGGSSWVAQFARG